MMRWSPLSDYRQVTIITGLNIDLCFKLEIATTIELDFKTKALRQICCVSIIKIEFDLVIFETKNVQ